MKRTLATIFLASTLLLTACESSDADNGDDNELTDNEEEQTSPEDENTESTDGEETDSPDEDEEPDEEIDDEEHTFLYEINETDIATVNVIEGEEANEQVALLTYDDAPDNYAVEIAEALVEHDAHAIFFVNGMYIESEEGQDMLRDIHEMGFAIGNHTHTHPNLTTISEEQQTEEILKTSDLVEEIIGERPRFFRAPFGANTDHTREVVATDGMVLMNWTYGYDYFEPYMESEKLAEAMITGRAPEIDIDYSLLKPGANLLMHDRSWTLEATPAIIEGLREQDYEIVDPDLIRSEPTESEETD